MNADRLRETMRLLDDCAALDDLGLALLVRRTTRDSKLGRAARAIERRRDSAALVQRDLSEMGV